MQLLTQYCICETATLFSTEKNAVEILEIMNYDYSEDLDYVVDYCKTYIPKNKHNEFEDHLTKY